MTSFVNGNTARNVPFENLSDAVRAGALDSLRARDDVLVAVMCAQGSSSAQATVRLNRVFGFPHVCSVRGGYFAWVTSQR